MLLPGSHTAGAVPPGIAQEPAQLTVLDPTQGPGLRVETAELEVKQGKAAQSILVPHAARSFSSSVSIAEHSCISAWKEECFSRDCCLVSSASFHLAVAICMEKSAYNISQT